MSYKFSQNSLKNLEGVHPDLIRVAKRALEISPYDFGITNGVRTEEEQRDLVESGASQTMNSYHLIQKDGYSHAIDFAVWAGGKITWDIKYYRPVIQSFFTAAIELGIQIESGGLWRSFVDGPHIQLNADFYRDKL